MNTDIRKGKPSASALPRLSKCNASWLLAKAAKEAGVEDKGNQWSHSGDRVHAWVETRSVDEWSVLSDDEQKTARKCENQIGNLVEDYFDENN